MAGIQRVRQRWSICAPAVDDKGNVIAWESEFYLPEGEPVTAPLIGATHAGLPSPPITEPAYHNIQYMAANSAIPYIFPNIETVAHLLAKAPLRWSWIRSPGRMQNTFANESFVDELAAFVGIHDPTGRSVIYCGLF